MRVLSPRYTMSIIKQKLQEYYEYYGERYSSPESIQDMLDFFCDLYEEEEEVEE